MASLDIGLFALQSQFRLPNSLRRKFLLYSQLRHPTIENRCQPDHHFQLLGNCFSCGLIYLTLRG